MTIENTNTLYNKALEKKDLTVDEALWLYEQMPLNDLILLADRLRQNAKPDGLVTWQIDRNVNITNVCVAQCRFCNFCRKPQSPDSFITNMAEYEQKIEALFALGGQQLLLQGGLHPDLDLAYYEDLFARLKQRFPDMKLHALGPPEVVYLSQKAGISYRETLERLLNAGLDSLPGAGAEILVDRVRRLVSPGKCTAQQWLDVMHEAHRLNVLTSATMMFGHVESPRERIEHLIKLRNLQAAKPKGHSGFMAFIAWPFQRANTRLEQNFDLPDPTTAQDYIRLVATCRIVLHNIPNIQASWLTVGKDTAQLCLHAGANDFGSIMIEEHVVSSAGANYRFDAEGIQQAIREAGFEPQLRNQAYDYL